MMAALACLPVLEAEAKARQCLSGGDKVSDIARAVNSALNEPLKATSSAESLKRIPKATQELVEFVVSLNTKRRHLTPSQLAVAAQFCLPVLEAEAKERQVLAGRLFGENHPQEVGSAMNQPLKATSSVESLKRIPKATQQASKIMGVGSTLISAAKAIAKVSPEMIEKIQSGEITVTVATKELQESCVLGSKKNAQPSISKIKEKDKAIADVPYTTAMQYARLAKSQLERIRKDDIGRVQALNFIIDIATKLLNNKKASS